MSSEYSALGNYIIDNRRKLNVYRIKIKYIYISKTEIFKSRTVLIIGISENLRELPRDIIILFTRHKAKETQQ